MSVENIGVIWNGWGLVDATLNGLTLFPATGTGGATAGPSAVVTGYVASPSNNEVTGTRCGLLIGFGSTITGGAVTVILAAEVNGTYQSASGTASLTVVGPAFQFTVNAQASTIVPVPLFIPAEDLPLYKVYVYNPSGNSPITVALYTGTFSGQSG